MKNLAFKTTRLFWVAAILMIAVTVNAQQKAVKEISESYTIKKGFELAVDNKYGEINIVNWDKNECQVVVTIEVEAASKAKAEEGLKKVEIQIDKGSNDLSLETQFKEKNWNKMKVEVIYDLKVPSYINASLEQQYGMIYIQELTGEVGINARYSDVNAGSLVQVDGAANNVDVAYGDITIEEVGSLNAKIRYGELQVERSQELNADLRYSRMKLGEANVVVIDSKYDKVSIDKLLGVLSIESAYTQAKIEELDAGFKAVSAEMSYGNLKAGLAKGAGFKIDSEVSYGSIDIPEGDLSREKDGMKKRVYGTVGKSNGASVEASMRYGNLVLK